jgi:sn-glycerol 3-phosphate transport system substrate-binding protein
MKKRVVALLCAMALFITIAALPVSAASSTAPSYVATKIPSSFPLVKQDSKATVVNFWHAMTGNNAVYVDDIVNWFNATTGKSEKIYVKPIYQGGYDAITIKIQAVIQANIPKDLPDLVQLNSTGAFSVKESSKIIYMQDMIDSDKTFNIKSKLNKNSTWGCSYKGKQLGMPFSNSLIMMHYNVAAFTAVGLDPDSPPKTLEELAAAVSKLTIKGSGKKPSRYGIACKISAYQFATWIPRQKAGAYVMNNEDGRLGTPTAISCVAEGTLKTTLTEWKKVVDTGGVDTAPTVMATSFATGNSTIILSSQTAYDTIETTFKGVPAKDKASRTFDHRMYRIPTVNADDSIGTAIGGAAVYMFNKGDNARRNATWQFVKFLSTADVSAYWYVKTNYFPLNNDAINTKYVQDYLNKTPNKKVCLSILTESASTPKFQESWMPSYGMFDSLTGDQALLCNQGKQTVDETVKNIKIKTERLLTAYQNANK